MVKALIPTRGGLLKGKHFLFNLASPVLDIPCNKQKNTKTSSFVKGKWQAYWLNQHPCNSPLQIPAIYRQCMEDRRSRVKKTILPTIFFFWDLVRWLRSSELVTFCQECSGNLSSLHASCQIEFVKWKISGAQPSSVKSAFSGFSSMRIDHEKLTEEIAALEAVMKTKL